MIDIWLCKFLYLELCVGIMITSKALIVKGKLQL